ncbi:hypothetical protein Leryth_015052 [Lithospermum erythrorhizon]|nr:hypothetical protein Leryth_015052 [Lithospermum erythrorhizon]
MIQNDTIKDQIEILLFQIIEAASTVVMGTGEECNTTKSSKPPSSVQEAPTMPAYPDWASSMQAYYGAGAPPPFYASTVASPTPHPYVWAGQHPLMPPYGTPIPYPAMYPPGGVYAHPNMTMTPGTAQVPQEPEGKSSESQEKAANKRSRATSGDPSGDEGKGRETGVIAGGEGGAVASGSGNDGASQSAETGGDSSSDASEDNNNHDYSATKKGSFNQMLADGANAQNHPATTYHTSGPGNPVVSMPVTNLNIGMELWNASSAASGDMKMLPNSSSVPASMMTDQWIQAECEELQHKVENLSSENRTLRVELERLSEECGKLSSENNSIKEQLVRLCGPDAVSKLENSSNPPLLLTHGDEDNS